MNTFLKTKHIFIILLITLIITNIIKSITGTEFYFCIKPFIYIGLCILIYLFTSPKYIVKKYKKFVNQITIMAIIGYMLLYFASGIIFSFANNPLSTSIYNIIFNILFYIPPAISIELIRYRLTNNFDHKKRFKNIIILSLILTLYMSNLTINDLTNIKSFIEAFYKMIVPNFVIGCFLSFVALNGSLYASLIYILTPIIFNLFSPIIPSPEWIITVLLQTIIPIICYTMINQAIPKENKLKTQKKTNIPYYASIIILTCVILFSCGIFRIYPVAIASNSMDPTFSRGDIQIIDKKKQEYQKGDIIQFYGINNTIFVHRVVSKRKEGNKTYYVTKGDNNKTVDLMEISEDKVIGKSILTIKYLGYPTLWISELL